VRSTLTLALALALGITLGAGGLALGDIATSSSGVPSGTVLTCAGKAGALRYVRHGGCQRGERRLVLADSAPLIATIPSLDGRSVESPGVSASAPAVGLFQIRVSERAARDIRRCAYIATPSVALQGGQITHPVEVVAAPVNAHTLMVRLFDATGAVATDGVSVEIYCPS